VDVEVFSVNAASDVDAQQGSFSLVFDEQHACRVASVAVAVLSALASGLFALLQQLCF